MGGKALNGCWSPCYAQLFWAVGEAERRTAYPRVPGHRLVQLVRAEHNRSWRMYDHITDKIAIFREWPRGVMDVYH